MTRASIALAGRALRVTLRRPQFLMPMLAFPSLLLAVNTGGLSQATNLPGFPTDTPFFDFQLPAALAQSLLFGGVGSGIAVALELELGFFDRLVAAPIPRTSIIAGRLISAGCIALIQVTWFVALGFVFGAEVKDGIGGLAIVYSMAVIAGAGFSAIGVMLAVRAGNASSVQGIFPLIFVVLFLSSAFFPINLLTSPVNDIARYNPLSYIANGMRAPITGTGDAGTILAGYASALGVLLVFSALAVRALHRRLGER